MNEGMSEGRIRKIAERAFKHYFSDVKIIQINVKPMLGHDKQRFVDVKIIYDGKYERLNGTGLVKVYSDIVSKAWHEVENDLGFPLVHFITKSDLRPHERRDPTIV